MKTHHFHTKLTYQKLMLRQIEWWVQNWPITKNGILPVTALFFRKFCFSLRTFYKSWFDIPTTQMSIFVLFLSAGVLFDCAFSPWVSSTHLPYSGWGGVKSLPPPTSFSPVTSRNVGAGPNTFLILVLTFLPHWCKILSSYLVLVPNYWTWTKATPQKKRFFW